MLHFYVDGVEKTDKILMPSFSFNSQNGTNGDTVSIESLEKFELLSLLEVKRDTTTIYKGKIRNISYDGNPKDIITYNVKTTDFTDDMDKLYIQMEYPMMKSFNILNSIVHYYCPGYTLQAEDDGIQLSINFNFKYPSEAFDDICKTTGYSWWVDYNKCIHYGK